MEEGIREQIKQTEDNARREKIKKEFEEFNKQVDDAVKSYVDELEKQINASRDKTQNDKLKELNKSLDKLLDDEKHADKVFENIKNKHKNK